MADAWELLTPNEPLTENSEVLTVHAALLPGGKVLYFGESERDEKPVSIDATRLWNPVTKHAERITSIPTVGDPLHPPDFFSCRHCLLPPGDLLVAEGTETYDGDAPPLHGDLAHFTGIQSTKVFGWGKERWRRVEEMRDGRFYLTLITLQDGCVLAMSGHPSAKDPLHENTLQHKRKSR